MKLMVLVVLTLLTTNAFAISCDCEVNVITPMTGPHQLPPDVIKTYELEEYSSYAIRNQWACRNNCQKEFEKDMPVQRLNALLITYGQNLINQRILGFNCTGLTTLKFPVRVKAKLGEISLGNVADQIHVVTVDEICF